jgi:benzodiazapine receptor
VEICLLYGTVAATAVAFHKINPTAGLIMIPYLGWLTLATLLNYCVWRDNREDEEEKSD